MRNATADGFETDPLPAAAAAAGGGSKIILVTRTLGPHTWEDLPHHHYAPPPECDNPAP